MPSPAFDGLPALPMVPKPAAVAVRSNHRTRSTQAESGRTLSRVYGGQFYTVNLDYNPMKRADAAPLIAFLQSRQGKDSEFKVEMGGFQQVAGAEVANFANFGDDTKLHMITQTAPTLEVYPAARYSGGTTYTDTVYMRASLVGDVQEVKIPRNGLIRLSIDLIERL